MTRKILILRVVRALALAGLALGLGGVDVACSSSSTPTCGGIVVDGKCMQKCTDSACAKGTRCLINDDNDECSRKCKTQNDCAVGTNCVTWGFPDGTKGQYCAKLPYTKGGNTGQYGACTADDTCDTMRGFKCVAGKCQIPCSTSADCASVGVCEASGTGGNSKTVCIPSGTGQLGSPCPNGDSDCDTLSGLRCIAGKCQTPCTSSADCSSVGVCGPAQGAANGSTTDVCVPDSKPRGPGQFGSGCPNDQDSECDTQDDFLCIGLVGSLDNYCTRADCQQDSDCPEDYFCSLQRTSTPPCQTTCGLQGDSSSTCAAASDIGPGKKYQCGPLTLLRHYCLKKSFCNECTSDADCLAYPGQVCASDGNGHKYCTVRCDPATGSCPWGTAAQCGVWDKTLGFATCRHRFGSCTGTGAGCDPCIDDGDCGTNGLCLVDQFSGEHYCVNLSDTCSCPAGSTGSENPSCNGGGCPETPGKLQGSCLGDKSQSSSALYDHCIGADINQGQINETPQTGCWPHNN
jgi:hypothetical protein